MMDFGFFRKAVSGGALVCVLLLAGCDFSGDIFDGVPGPGAPVSTTATGNGSSRNNSIQLVANAWADGAITSTAAEQWFSFTAIASIQYVHVSRGILDDLYVQLYDSNGSTLGSRINIDSSSDQYISLSVISGLTYYIKVTPYGYSTGTYRIAFNTMLLPPGTLDTATALSYNTWADGVITSTARAQWFTFTATSSTVYIHFSPGSLDDVYVQLYDDISNSMVGSVYNCYSGYSGHLYFSRTVTYGQTYHVKVWPYYSSHTGTYRIAFNGSPTPPVPY